MKKKLAKVAVFAAFSFVSLITLNACGDDVVGSPGIAGQNGRNGADGRNGDDGKDGTSCYASALSDGSGYELSCGGKVIGTIKNGKDGVNGLNGTDGQSCTSKILSDKNGYELTCGGEVVALIRNGDKGSDGQSCMGVAAEDGSVTISCGGEAIGTIRSGSDGKSCSATELEDGSGYKLVCGDQVVGTIKNGTNGANGSNGVNGKDGTSCTAEALEDESGFELTCDGQVVGTIKNGTNGTNGSNGTSCTAKALDDEFGFELKCGTKVVGIIKNGKDVEKVKGSGFDAWYYGKNTADGIAEACGGDDRVVSDAMQDCDDYAGFWYADLYGQTTALWGPDFKTKTVLDCSSEPCQTIVNGDFEHVAEIIDENGIFVEVSQNQADRVNEDEWQGFNLGVNFTADEENGADVSHWRGLCLKYTVDRPEMRLVLRIASSAVPAGGNDSDRNFTLPETLEEPSVINIPWSDFKTAEWVTIDKIVPLVTTVKHLLGIKFEYSLWAFDGDDDNDNDPENMKIRFNLQKIGAYGTCED